jgi:uncharacterized Zn finger protein (UPF0148 family)
MNMVFYNAIRDIISEQGEAILGDGRRVGAYLADYAGNEPKAQRKAFVRCLELGFYAALKNASGPEQAAVKTRLVRRLHDEEGYDRELCAVCVELLGAVMFGGTQAQRRPVCAKCGRELQDGWTLCPYCGEKVGKTLQEEKSGGKTEAPVSGVATAPPTAKSSNERGVPYHETGKTGPAGGIVLFVGQQRLEVAPASTEFRANWDDAKRRCASLRVNGIGGWRLPDKDELDAMYKQLKKNGQGGFSDDWYWSSSESHNNDAWYQRFSDGYQLDYRKYNAGQVRAVRAF